MKPRPLDVYRCEFFIRYLNPRGVSVRIQFGSHLQPGSRRRIANQVDYHRPTSQGLPSPVLGNVAKHTVFDLVPLARPRREVADRDAEPQLIGQLLQPYLPQP